MKNINYIVAVLLRAKHSLALLLAVFASLFLTGCFVDVSRISKKVKLSPDTLIGSDDQGDDGDTDTYTDLLYQDINALADLTNVSDEIQIILRNHKGEITNQFDFSETSFSASVKGAGSNPMYCLALTTSDGLTNAGKCEFLEAYKRAKSDNSMSYTNFNDTWKKNFQLYNSKTSSFSSELVAGKYELIIRNSEGKIKSKRFEIFGKTTTKARLSAREAVLKSGEFHAYMDFDFTVKEKISGTNRGILNSLTTGVLPEGVTIETLHSGDAPAGKREEWLFINEEYSSDYIDHYHSKTEKALDKIFSQVAFHTYQNYIRLRKVTVDPGEKPDMRSVRRNHLGTTHKELRFYGYPARSFAKPEVGYANIYYSWGNQYTGSGTALHELLHLYWLWDEYEVDRTQCQFFANLSTREEIDDSIENAPWANWSSTTGVYNTGGVCGPAKHKQVRPYRSDIMSDSSKSMYSVHTEQVIKNLYRQSYISPLADSTLEGSYDSSIGKIEVKPMKPIGHDIDVKWFVDDKQVNTANPNYITVNEIGTQGSGEHEVRVVAVDPTDLVRDESWRYGFMREERIWTVDIGDSPDPPGPDPEPEPKEEVDPVIRISKSSFDGASSYSFKLGQDRMYITVENAGPNAKACMQDSPESNPGTFGYCHDLSNFTDMSPDLEDPDYSEWDFLSSSKTWRLFTDLSKATYYYAGDFEIYWHNPDTGKTSRAYIYTIIP